MKRRSLLKSFGAVPFGLGFSSTATTADTANENGTVSSSCKYSSDTESKSTTDETYEGDLDLSTKATEEQGTRDTTNIYGNGRAEWTPDQYSGKADYIKIYVKVTASTKIADAPARFEVDGDTARYSRKKQNDDRYGIYISTRYDRVYGESNDFGCSPDMEQQIQVVVVTEEGVEYSESHTLDPE